MEANDIYPPSAIAIIGIGCRFPGNASTPLKFWNMLCRGIDAISEVPHTRWDTRRFYDSDKEAPGKMYVKKGGFLREKWEEFDAEFFHISPREAEFLDPQQRLLLEITWEALEDGGIVPETLKGSDTGVFIGGFTTDWQTLQNSPYNLKHCGRYTGINSSSTILSARLSHFFDLKGPCLTLDTACSSSLVAIDLACQHLRQQHCSLAIVGGVNAMLIPETTVAMSKGNFLNPEGHCRSFDANANGYVRGEGAGIVLLKRLADAMRDNDPLYAVIRGTGVNHDGNTPGIAQPNPEAQKNLIQKVLLNAGVDPSQVHYVEAHGTGTPVGDPIEAQALDEVLNISGKRQFPCFLGAVKTNLGHLEAAAGIAGLIKTALCLKYKLIPPNLHFKTPNPLIPFEQYCLRIPTSLESFPSPHSLFACVNSFGYGGTNAHVVLQNYETVFIEGIEPSPSHPFFFPISSKTHENLKTVAKEMEGYLQENPQTKLTDLSYTLREKRSHFEHRAALSALTIDELKQKLQQISQGNVSKGCAIGKKLDKTPELVFVYSGMGPQWWGMGRQLMQTSPVFMNVLKQCDTYVKELAGWSLIEELQKDEACSKMNDPIVSQLANFSLQAALTLLMKSWGIIPRAVVGHSIGEVAAAFASGALSLEEGLQVSFHRSRIQSMRQDLGTMLAVGLSRSECDTLLSAFEGRISVAAENGAHALTLAGSKEDLTLLEGQLNAQNVFHKFLKVTIAYHSHQMDGLEDLLLSALKNLTPKTPSIPFYSTVYGEELSSRKLDAEYWWKNIRQPVLFSKAMQRLNGNGYNLFLEIGPHPVLSSYIKEAIQSSQINGNCLSTLHRNKQEVDSLMECLAGLYVNGLAIDWSILYPQGQFIRLPTYRWQKKPYWIESEESQQYRLSTRHHPFLSRKMMTPNPTYQVEINNQYFPWLDDHQIDGTTVFPAAAYVEAGLAIAGTFPCVLENVHFNHILTVQKEKTALLQISLDQDSRQFKVHSLIDASTWQCHATGKSCQYTLNTSIETINLNRLREFPLIEKEAIYAQFTAQGLEYGLSFQGIKQLWKNGKEALAELHVQLSNDRCILHPTLLDSALQTLIGTVDNLNGMILPYSIDQLIINHPVDEEMYCHAVCTKQTTEKIIGDLFICTINGRVCAEIKGLECRILRTPQSETKQQTWLYHSIWEEVSIDSSLIQSENKDPLITINLSDLRCFDETVELIKKYANENSLAIALIAEGGKDQREASRDIHYSIACINVVKAIEQELPLKQVNLWIATCMTQSVKNEDNVHYSGSSLWGLGRVIRQEYPAIRLRLIDLDENDTDCKVLSAERLLSDNNDEIAWRQNKRYVHRYKRKTHEPQQTLTLTSPEQAFALYQRTPGVIDSLTYQEIQMTVPGPSEVAVRVHSSSLNFKDLMKVLGIIDSKALEDTFFGQSFGMECSGTIVSVGPEVKHHQVGDHVCCFTPNTFQSYITLSEHQIFQTPPGTDLAEAALYIPFITVLRALKHIAALKKGETVLLHSATGAVGLAAIQYAKFVGARILATAGSEDKRNYLRGLGVAECADSRSLSFVEDIRSWTDNRGVDVVLNSLSNDALMKSWSLMAPYGRFIEIGKRDISANSGLPMGTFNRNTLFASIDLDRSFIDQPALIQKLLKETHHLFAKGVFKPLHCHHFPASEVCEAFQLMARSKHIGKIMLEFENQAVLGETMSTSKPFVSGNATYLVTGGFSGFGLSVVKWLVEKGAKYVVIISRRGAVSSEAKQMVEQLRKTGVTLKEACVDVTHHDQLTTLLEECSHEMPPLKGVIHSAMVLNDGLISQLSEESVIKVMKPKMEGCLNLHHSTKNCSLDFFVLFSSISSIIGNPGQANYAAANAFLDSFTHYRKSQHLPTLTINWGALKTGALVRDSKIADYLHQQGIAALPIDKALAMLEKAICDREHHLSIVDMNWKKMMNNRSIIGQSSMFSDFIEFNEENGSTTQFNKQLEGLDETSQLNITISALKEMIGKTLKMESAQLDEGVRLNALGVDSLMAMELHTLMECKLGIRIPSMELMKGPSIKELAGLILCKGEVNMQR